MKRLLASYLSVFLLLSIIGLSACTKSAPDNIDFCYGIGYVKAEPEALAYLESKLDEIIPHMFQSYAIEHPEITSEDGDYSIIITPPFCIEHKGTEETSENPTLHFTVFYMSRIIGTISVFQYDGEYNYNYSQNYLVKELSTLTKDNLNRKIVQYWEDNGTAPKTEIQETSENDAHSNKDNVLFIYSHNKKGS